VGRRQGGGQGGRRAAVAHNVSGIGRQLEIFLVETRYKKVEKSKDQALSDWVYLLMRGGWAVSVT